MTNRGYSTTIHSNNNNRHHWRTIIKASLTETRSETRSAGKVWPIEQPGEKELGGLMLPVVRKQDEALDLIPQTQTFRLLTKIQQFWFF